jgi:hypothetical protein
MVPDFNDDGVLPEGEHVCSMEEFKRRFVFNETRAKIFAGLLKLIADIKLFGCKTIYIGGSFVINKDEPGDIDVCWEDDDETDWDLIESEFQILFDMDPPRYWQQSVYSADIFPANITEGNTGKLFKDFFKTDTETNITKGIIKMRI